MKISNKLNIISEFVSNCNIALDVGTDHAYLPILLIKKNKVNYVIGTDINIYSINKSIENISKVDCSLKIKILKTDNIFFIKNENIDLIIISGLGGNTIKKILFNPIIVEDVKKINEIVICPQSDIENIRDIIYKNGFVIIDETIVKEANKYYPIIKFCSKNIADKNTIKYIKFLKKEDILYGPILIKNNSKLFQEYLLKEFNKVNNILNNILLNSEKDINDYSKDIILKKEILERLLKNEVVNDNK